MTGDAVDVWLNQEGREKSLDEQMAAIREYAAEHSHLQLVKKIKEGASTSVFNNDREKYNRLVEKVRT